MHSIRLVSTVLYVFLVEKPEKDGEGKGSLKETCVWFLLHVFAHTRSVLSRIVSLQVDGSPTHLLELRYKCGGRWGQ